MNSLRLITILVISVACIIGLNYLVFYKHISIYGYIKHDNNSKKEVDLNKKNEKLQFLHVSNAKILKNDSKILPFSQLKVIQNDNILSKTMYNNGIITNNNADITLHTVTYASHHGRDDRFCRAIESAVRYQYNLVILGWDIPWKGLSQKLEAAHAYASSIPPNDLLLFIDAFDVLFTNSPNEIINQFKHHNKSILFSAECGCWPHIMENHGYVCFHTYPSSPTPYRYLNSGTWIGKASLAKDMLAEVIREAGKDFKNANDQKLVADMFISKRFDISLDYYNTIFQSMHMTLDPPLPRCNPYEDMKLKSLTTQSNKDINNNNNHNNNNNNNNKENNKYGTWHNKRTSGKPAVIHFNGGGKRYHLEMENKMWYKKYPYNSGIYKQNVLNYIINVPSIPSKKMKFSELCKNYLH